MLRGCLGVLDGHHNSKNPCLNFSKTLASTTNNQILLFFTKVDIYKFEIRKVQTCVEMHAKNNVKEVEFEPQCIKQHETVCKCDPGVLVAVVMKWIVAGEG